MEAIKVNNLKYVYPDGTAALNGVSLKILPGKRVALLGANGSGKTTLIYHFNGLFLPQTGSVHILGCEVNKKALPHIRRQVGLLFDSPDNQLLSTTVFNDVAFGPRNLNMKEDAVRDTANRIMSMVNITELQDKAPFNISLGQKKKVAIAGLLAMSPRIFVFDEPFSGLDPLSARQVAAIMQTLNDKGCTMVISTHDVDMAYSWADQVIILNNGDLLGNGDISLLRNRELMKKANLRVPALADIFEGTGLFPRNNEEAKKCIRDYISYKVVAKCL